MNEEIPKWCKKFVNVIQRYWKYNSPCSAFNVQPIPDPKSKSWVIRIAPIFQEVYGGDDDGKKVWSGFIFDFGDFAREEGVWIREYAIASYCAEHTNHPQLMIDGKYQGHKFKLSIILEPITETSPVEIIDTIHQKLIAIPDDAEDAEDA